MLWCVHGLSVGRNAAVWLAQTNRVCRGWKASAHLPPRLACGQLAQCVQYTGSCGALSANQIVDTVYTPPRSRCAVMVWWHLF